MKPVRMRWSLVPMPDYMLCLSRADLSRQLRRMGLPTDAAEFPATGANMHTFDAEGGGPALCIVCLSDVSGHTGVEVAALLVHEAVHIWQEIRDGLKEDDPSAEFEAYSVQSLAQGLMSEYVRQTRMEVAQ